MTVQNPKGLPPTPLLKDKTTKFFLCCRSLLRAVVFRLIWGLQDDLLQTDLKGNRRRKKSG